MHHNAGYLKEEKVTRKSIEELVKAWGLRYRMASRKEKTRILDEFVAVTGYHRKSAIRALTRKAKATDRRGRPRIYTNEVKAALIELWELSGKLCSKRLAPFLAEFIEVLERSGELRLRPQVKQLLAGISSATIDRLLKTHRLVQGRRGPAPRRANQLKKKVPVRTSWGKEGPGYVELDLVVHCGQSTKGEYLHTLNVVDIATSWCEPVALRNRSQEAVKEGLKEVRQRLPFPLVGIDSDNDSAFLNGQLWEYCEQEEIEFTRCRPYRKNDQAHIEQKNWVAVRQLIGYDRYEGEEAFRLLEEIYADWRLLLNFFVPVRKLIGKERVGSKVKKIYDRAQTPYQRVLSWGQLDEGGKRELEGFYEGLNLVEIRRRLEDNLRQLWGSMGNPNSEATPPLR